MRVLDTHELAWAAGLFDGEGSVGAYVAGTPRKIDGSRALGLRAVIVQTDPQVLRRFQVAVQGLGRVTGPRVTHRDNEKPIWNWGCYTFEHTQAVLAMLWNYLSPVKREQFKLAQTKFLSQARLKSESLRGNQNAKGKRWTKRTRMNHLVANARRRMA
jgi:hypothetical protein